MEQPNQFKDKSDEQSEIVSTLVNEHKETEQVNLEGQESLPLTTQDSQQKPSQHEQAEQSSQIESSIATVAADSATQQQQDPIIIKSTQEQLESTEKVQQSQFQIKQSEQNELPRQQEQAAHQILQSKIQSVSPLSQLYRKRVDKELLPQLNILRERKEVLNDTFTRAHKQAIQDIDDTLTRLKKDSTAYINSHFEKLKEELQALDHILDYAVFKIQTIEQYTALQQLSEQSLLRSNLTQLNKYIEKLSDKQYIENTLPKQIIAEIEALEASVQKMNSQKTNFDEFSEILLRLQQQERSQEEVTRYLRDSHETILYNVAIQKNVAEPVQTLQPAYNIRTKHIAYEHQETFNPTEASICSITFFNGQLLTGGWDGALSVFSAKKTELETFQTTEAIYSNKNQQIQQSLPTHLNNLELIEFIPSLHNAPLKHLIPLRNGAVLTATTSSARTVAYVKILRPTADAKTLAVQQVLPFEEGLYAIAQQPERDYLLTDVLFAADGGKLSVHDLVTYKQKLQVQLPECITAMEFSADVLVAATECGSIYLLQSTQNYSLVYQLSNAHDDWISCIAVCGTFVATGSHDNAVKIWKLDKQFIDTVNINSDSDNQPQSQLCTLNLQQHLVGHTSHIAGVQFLNDNSVLSAGECSLILWNTTLVEERAHVQMSALSEINAFILEGSSVFVAGVSSIQQEVCVEVFFAGRNSTSNTIL